MSTDNDQIQTLLSQKASATPDQARRIRRQLRALGYRISDRARSETAEDGQKITGTRIKKARKQKGSEEYPDMVFGKRLTSSPVMTEDAITELSRSLQEDDDLVIRSRQSITDDEYGYGFDLIGKVTKQEIVEKFMARWPEHEPEWFTILGEPGTIRVLIIGPVKPSMGVTK